ncbi:hypothetical protein BV22DRAFT_436343 [Leucogyrophana mollusca]|uniref:Uncharacterized protein n=1 Tax=Leucogyrophana mollusca TaxID=85980 RepID=A0ACB8BHR2_9AGAM|nr:hypothetical protein BV22DRAFT_436343 [Leucogyrophana mollusca]
MLGAFVQVNILFNNNEVKDGFGRSTCVPSLGKMTMSSDLFNAVPSANLWSSTATLPSSTDHLGDQFPAHSLVYTTGSRESERQYYLQIHSPIPQSRIKRVLRHNYMQKTPGVVIYYEQPSVATELQICDHARFVMEGKIAELQQQSLYRLRDLGI